MGVKNICLLFVALLPFAMGKYVYKVTTIHEPPFLMFKGAKKDAFFGFIPDVLESLSTLMNASFSINHVLDYKYGTMKENGEWTGMIGELQRKEADIAAAIITATSMRANVVDFSHPIRESGLSIVIKKPTVLDTVDSISDVGVFLMFWPFHATVWVAFLCSFVLMAIVYGVIIQMSPLEDNSRTTVLGNIGKGFIVIFYRFCFQGTLHKACESASAKVLISVWCLFVIILLSTYVAALSSFIFGISHTTSAVLQRPVHDFENLATTDIRYGTLKSGATYNYFINSRDHLDQIIGQHLKTNPEDLTNNVIEGIQRVRNSNGEYAFIMEEDMAHESAGKPPCDLMVIDHSNIKRSYAFACTPNTTICRELDIAILKMKESGELNMLNKKWLRTGDCNTDFDDDYIDYINAFTMKMSGKSLENSTSKVIDVISMKNIGGLFVLLAIGIVLSIIVLVYEICTNKSRRSSNKDDKQPFEAIDNEL